MKYSGPFPSLQFADPVSPWRWSFTWLPQLTWDGRWLWLVPCWKRMVQRHTHLDGPGNDRWFQYHFPWGYVKQEIAR